MSINTTFNQVKKEHLKTLKQYVPIVARVHGAAHPEFYKVAEVFEAIVSKLNESNSNQLKLDEEFSQLQTITKYYTIPSDVCESYEAVYTMLKAMDEAYHA